ncbi:DUF4426 domain-containing protein [Rhizobacter fulvus]
MSTLTPATAAAALALAACLSATAPPAAAQSHVKNSGDYRLRASTTSAANLPPAVREEHGIPTDPNTAVLNVTVQHQEGGAMRNVAARLEVQVHNLLGARSPVAMREVTANDRVSYMGTYRLLPREVLDFRVTAHPEGARRAITLQFRDRLGRR